MVIKGQQWQQKVDPWSARHNILCWSGDKPKKINKTRNMCRRKHILLLFVPDISGMLMIPFKGQPLPAWQSSVCVVVCHLFEVPVWGWNICFMRLLWTHTHGHTCRSMNLKDIHENEKNKNKQKNLTPDQVMHFEHMTPCVKFGGSRATFKKLTPLHYMGHFCMWYWNTVHTVAMICFQTWSTSMLQT